MLVAGKEELNFKALQEGSNSSSWWIYNQQEEVLNQKSLTVIDHFIFDNLAVDNAGQKADNKHTGSMTFLSFLLVSKTDKPTSHAVSKTHLLTVLFLHMVHGSAFLYSPFKLKFLVPSNDEFP